MSSTNLAEQAHKGPAGQCSVPWNSLFSLDIKVPIMLFPVSNDSLYYITTWDMIHTFHYHSCVNDFSLCRFKCMHMCGHVSHNPSSHLVLSVFWVPSWIIDGMPRKTSQLKGKKVIDGLQRRAFHTGGTEASQAVLAKMKRGSDY